MPRNGSGIFSLPAGSIVTDGVSTLLATQHNTPLNDIADALNEPAPVVAGGTGVDTIAEVALAVKRDLRATYGGTADAITLTTGLSYTAVTTGQQIRFRATSANTTAATINLDAIGAVACRTITGVALPASYIRTDVDTVATYDGTYWVLGREIERGSNANGQYVRFADGTLICTNQASIDGMSINTAAGVLYRSTTYTYTLPATFTNNPYSAAMIGASDNASIRNNFVSAKIRFGSTVATNDWTGIVFIANSSITGAGGEITTIGLYAIGEWY